MDPIVIALAFVAGTLFSSMGLPPLLGFLLAGFAGNFLGFGSLESLAPLADAGILLLLFTIGLKLDPLDLKPRYVWGSALVHIAVVVPLTAAVLTVLANLYEPLAFGHPAAAWTLALLTGILCCFGFGALFDVVGLKDGLGALVGGMLVRYWHAEKGRELYRQLAGIKDLLLIGFFVQIGYYGLPSFEMLMVAALITVLTVLRPFVYFALFSAFGLRVRTSYERAERLPVEQIGSLGDASTVVLGMGRVGRGAYDALDAQGAAVVGVEENMSNVVRHQADGYHCIHGDASDRDFWERTGLAQRDFILVSLSSHREHVLVAELARALGFTGTLAVAARFADEAEELEAMGCVAYYRYEGIGRDFAMHSLDVHQRALEAG